MHSTYLEEFNDSYDRCIASGRLIDRFYELFLQDPEIAEFFRTTDFSKQKRALQMSLYLMMMAVIGQPEGSAHLQRIAESHRMMDIKPHHFDLWLNALLQAVAECDSEYTPATADAWRYIMGHGVRFMQQKCAD